MRRCLILAALLVAATFARLPFLALAGEPILVAKTLYIDSDGDGVLDTDVSLAPSGTTPASDQLEITAPGGVEIVTGALVVTAGGATFAGELTATLDQNGTTDLTVSNPNAGASASARVSLTNDTGTVRAFELRGSGQASYADHLLIHVPAASLAGFFDNTTKELELAIDAANDEVTVAHDLVIEEAIVIESLGTTSAPAIHFAEGTVPANTGLRVTTSTGDLVFRINATDIFTAKGTGAFEVASSLVVLSGGKSTLTGDTLEMDSDDDAATLSYNDTNNEWEFGQDMLAPVASAGQLTLLDYSATLTADDQVLSPAGRTYVLLDSDDATATNRTLVLGDGSEAGHALILQFVAASNAMELLDDGATDGGGGNVRLSADWTPGQYDSLSLIFDGTDWIETGRSNN